MKRLITVLAATLFAQAAGGLAVAQSDPFVGTWKLNVTKSKFHPGPGPKSQTRTWAADGRVSVEGLNAAGKPVAYGYPIKADGKDYPTTGAVPNSADTISSKRIDANTIEATFTRRGKPADKTRFAVSRDAKVLTMTAKGTLPDGKALDDLLVLDKQAMPGGGQASHETVTTTNQQAVAAATTDFYAALNTMFAGNGRPMKDAWSRARDITYMGPDGLYLIGWEKIEQEWNTQTANKLGGRVTPQQLHTVVGDDLAVITCIESGENIVNGKNETVQIRSSTLFRKENGAWKVIGHQTDPLKYMDKPKLVARVLPR